MHYLIDGYNLLHAIGRMPPKMGPTGLQNARLSLLGLIAGALREESSAVTVVFDAANAPPDVPHTFIHRGVHVEFADKGEQADDVIEDLIRRHSTPTKLTVVSNDQRLVTAAKRRRAHPQNCDAFFEFLQRQYRRRPPSAEPSEKSHGLKAGETDFWLKEFGDLSDDPVWAELDPFAAMDDNS